MTFVAGQPKVPGSGRKKGTPNKRTAAINDVLCQLTEQQLPRLTPLIETMGQSKQVNAILKLLALTLPRAGMTAADGEDEDTAGLNAPDGTSPHLN